MFSAWWVLGGAIGSALSSWATIIVARRRSSGTVRSTEATTLWDAQENLRHDLTAEVERRGREITRLTEEMVDSAKRCRAEVATLRQEIADLTIQLYQARLGRTHD